MCKETKINTATGEIAIVLSVSELRKLYAEATHDGKKMLEAVCQDKSFFIAPSLDDYKSIKTYEDACTALGEEPLKEDALLAAGADAHVIALMKLETISKALWGRDFKPVPQAEWDGETWYWYVLWYFYSKREIDDIKAHPENNKDIAALFGGSANNGASAGFGFLLTYHRPAGTNAHIGFRLCQQNEERARYFGAQFAELWAEYLAWGFKIEERII